MSQFQRRSRTTFTIADFKVLLDDLHRQLGDDAANAQVDRVSFISKNLYPYSYILQYKTFTVNAFTLFVTLQIYYVLDELALRPTTGCYSRGDHINGMVFFLLQVFLTIVTPTVCFAQLQIICNVTSLTSSYHTLYPEQQRLLKERNLSLYCRGQPTPTFSWKAFQPLIHALILPFVLYYFGIFRSKCAIQIYGVQGLEVWDCISVFVTLLLSGVLKDLFCLENHLATLSCSNAKVFRAIRNRWLLTDWYLYLSAIVLAVLTFTVLVFGVPFTPSYITLQADEKHFCNVLAVTLTLLQFAGSSSWCAMKTVSVVACCIIYPVALVGYYTGSISEQTSFHIAPGSIVVLLLYTTQAVTLINWLLCLICCYWRHNELKTKSYSTYSCLLSLVSVSICLFCIGVREIG